jgi:hypothetical protein
MKYQDYICDETQKAADAAFKEATFVPADKVGWKPLDEGRSVLDQCQEMAQCPAWCEQIISGDSLPAFDEEMFAKIMEERKAWPTIEACKAECNRRLESLFKVIRSTSDEQLAKTKFLPFGGGREHTWQEMMDYPRWNFVYHLGQISYVQTLYGDKEMH